MAFEQRLPAVNGDDGQWGDILNQFISKEHANSGVDDPANGGHKTITVQAGTTAAGTAPLKFSSGSLMSTPEVGAIEFLTDRLYFTQTTGTSRKAIALTDDIHFTPTAIWGDGVNPESIQAGTTTYITVPYSGTIISWYIVASATATCQLDVWKAAGSLPTVANTITAAAKPSLASATTANSSTLTGWTTAVTSGDVFGFNLDSFSGTPTSITLVLNIS
jgi:hypothetical protein